MRSIPVILLVFLSVFVLATAGTQQIRRRCKSCSKNVWLGMDRASKCPQLNGAVVPAIRALNATTIMETPVQPRLYGRRGVYNANCEWMVIVVRNKGCILLDTDTIEFECENNRIYFQGREVTSYVCALSVFPDIEMVL
ncbi:hypothetical protein CRE_27830 [Caenorhabditis remanei]|uniref:DUF281 domain-containing protein n=1 Tax=Caenorhabditis remanei TaxID=31234 RepID=E3N5K9_CAERE|nr:hypothetical protein CRE_27830 [Caenorhabditis remanei]